MRELRPEMRALLVAFSVLTVLAVIALLVLSTATDRYVAWTIQPPLTAAIMGAGHAAGCVLVVPSLRDPVWAYSRLAVLTILVFTLITLAATLVHLDPFHLQPEFAALQLRAPGSDPPPGHPVPVVLRAAPAVESAVLLVVGVPLWVAPCTAPTLWPWPLTPRTARVVAAWLIAFGMATALATLAGRAGPRPLGLPVHRSGSRRRRPGGLAAATPTRSARDEHARGQTGRLGVGEGAPAVTLVHGHLAELASAPA